VQFERVALLGLGLIGGSLGLAIRDANLARQITGYDPAPGVAERARALGAIDAPTASPSAAAESADLIILAAPPLATGPLLRAIAPVLSASAVVTDVASTKARICSLAEHLLPYPERFVGGHPMAGSEQSGIDASRVDLLRGANWCLTPTGHTSAEVADTLSTFVTQLGMTPLRLDPAYHDRLIGGVSHLPLLAASALMQTLASSADWPAAATLAAGGLRDTTRVASGDPVMARDICFTNGPVILAWLDAYIDELRRMRALIAGDDTSIHDIFQAARAARNDWLAARTSGHSPA
jgi:prephenate dehydrogenase